MFSYCCDCFASLFGSSEQEEGEHLVNSKSCDIPGYESVTTNLKAQDRLGGGRRTIIGGSDPMHDNTTRTAMREEKINAKRSHSDSMSLNGGYRFSSKIRIPKVLLVSQEELPEFLRKKSSYMYLAAPHSEGSIHQNLELSSKENFLEEEVDEQEGVFSFDDDFCIGDSQSLT